MGLLDNLPEALTSDQGLLGLALMASGAPRAGGRTSLGEGLLGAAQMVAAQKRAREEAAMKARMQQAQLGLLGAQLQEHQMKVKAAEESAMQDRAFQEALNSRTTPSQALAGGGGPTPANAAQIGQQQPLDYDHLSRQFPGRIDLIEKLSKAPNFGRQEVARTVEGRDAQGRPVMYQLDKYGQPQGAPIEQWKAPVQADTGGALGFVDPVTMRMLQQFQKTQSPDSAASNQLGWANFGLSKQRLAQEMQNGQLVETPNGYVRVGKDNNATPITLGGQPLMGKGAGLTEDQGKATGWLVQAQNAYKNMLTAGFEKGDPSKPKSAAYPGVNDALERLPLVGGLANVMRAEDRQKFIQSSESLAEALLRAATGAGVNKDEARQKVDELTPKFGEDKAVTQQKMAAIPLYIESLKVRAGPGAPKAQTIFGGGNSGGASGSWDNGGLPDPLGIRSK